MCVNEQITASIAIGPLHAFGSNVVLYKTEDRQCKSVNYTATKGIDCPADNCYCRLSLVDDRLTSKHHSMQKADFVILVLPTSTSK